MKEYDHKKIERKWQKEWEKSGIYHAQNNSKKPKYYSLIEFPYPSGAGMHVGHIRSNTAMDIISRKRRMEGFNVLYPIGWDAFGLPTENYAIKTGIHPIKVTKDNTDTFRKQLKSLGFSFDWLREINTTDPKYYKWTQWIFLQLLKKGLAYKAKMLINWCPKDKIGLANEEVVPARPDDSGRSGGDGVCERCGTVVEKREKEQWMLAITKYADRLYKDLDNVDYLPQIKLGQRNWIGRSEGAEIIFNIERGFDSVKVFTTRPDTIFGATFLALAPEIAKKITSKDYGIKVDTDRDNKEKVGVDTGLKAKNPASGELIPVFAVNYVSADYGTGAIMGVPAHDERDFEFAKKYGLEIRYVVAQVEKEVVDPPKEEMPFIYRKAVDCYVRNPKDNTFLMLEWKKAKWRTGITGGVEKGEDMIQAARREIYEETGYKNLKFIKELGTPLRVEFYHPGKNENRRADFYGLYFELENTEHDEIAKEEKEKHSIVWVPSDKVKSFLTTSTAKFENIGKNNLSYDDGGVLINSGQFSGMDSEKAKKEIIKFVGGKEKVTFKLRDWIFSRQRYWGEPIPVIHCPSCAKASAGKEDGGWIPVPEKDLPVELPKVKNYQPTASGESPLANIPKWVNVKCPKCKGKAKRETDTMPNWAGSSWYYLRYTDPKNNKEFASKENLKYWTPVDWYNGGMEHTTLHLLYSRFWHKFLYDLKLVPTSEPYMKRTSHGMILAEGGDKMSKSKDNVVNPDDLIKTYGADTLRMYEMFMGPFDQSVAWSSDSMIGPRRFLERAWNLQDKITPPQPSPKGREEFKASPFGGGREGVDRILNETIKKVTEDIETMKFNTAISTLMIFVNEISKSESISQGVYETFLKILSPFAPHITEELWQILGHKKSINLESWPAHDASKIKDEEIKIVIQINGKLRGEMMIEAGDSEEDIKGKAIENEVVRRHIAGQTIKKVIYINNRLINIVV